MKKPRDGSLGLSSGMTVVTSLVEGGAEAGALGLDGAFVEQAEGNNATNKAITISQIMPPDHFLLWFIG